MRTPVTHTVVHQNFVKREFPEDNLTAHSIAQYTIDAHRRRGFVPMYAYVVYRAQIDKLLVNHSLVGVFKAAKAAAENAKAPWGINAITVQLNKQPTTIKKQEDFITALMADWNINA